MGLSRLSTDGGGGSLRVGGKQDRDRAGGSITVKHVSVQVPRLDIYSWQVVPAT